MITTAVSKLYPWQRNLVVIAWLTYAGYYLGRVNLAAALPAIESDLSLTKSQVGIFVTGFFWAYAFGQLVNGQLGDRLSPRRLVFIGLLVSAGLNFAFGSFSNFIILAIIWTVNGYFQATGWGPVLRTLANWLTPAQRRKISTIFGTCFVAGNAIALLLAGWLVSNFGWRMAFIVPAILLVVTAVFWYLSVRDTPEAAGHSLEGTDEQIKNKKPLHLGQIVNGLMASLRRFWSLSFAAAFVGFCLVTIIVWLPTYYVEVVGVDIGLASSVSALVPVSGIAGALLIGWLVDRYFSSREAIGLMLVLVLLALLFLVFSFLPAQLVLSTLGLMLIGGVVYGASSLTLTAMPLSLGKQEEASSTAGLIDFSLNIGGGLSGIAVGAILQSLGWDFIFLTLAGAAIIGAFFVGVTARRL